MGGNRLTTELKLPPTIAEDMREVRDEQELRAPDAWKNGMHAWHAGTNTSIANRTGLIGASLTWIAGLIHETPIDSGSFQAEQQMQGTVNHILDSSTDILANTFGAILGLALPRRLAISIAISWGNHIPGPGDPDPLFGGGGTHTYKGSPKDAWGQYPN